MNIVLFGDSNTYGYSPEGLRYENRYSNILKNYYDNKINIFEEGLVGRTTIYDDIRPNRKALDDIDIILSKYNYIDLLIIMLGTNDYKKKNARNINDLKYGMESLLNKINKNRINKILLISPILLSKNIESLDNEFDYESYLLSLKGSNVYQELAVNNNFEFLDAKNYATPGSDGEHLTLEGHKNLGNAIIEVINNIWK